MNQGDIISFYYNNKVLVKRVIAFTGDWVNVAEDGYIYVNNELLDEPYLKEGALGECDIEMPYQVPEGRILFAATTEALLWTAAAEQSVVFLRNRLWEKLYSGSGH